MSEEIRIHISGMIYNQTIGGTYSLVMSEDEGLQRRFSVLIGESEAQSIALKLNNTIPPRPLSHDLMSSIIRMLNAKLIKVVIYNMKDEIFYSNIYLMQGSSVIVIDARTSDAVALAVRNDVPIYINSDILNIVGTVVDEVSEKNTSKYTRKKQPITLENYSSYMMEELTNIELEELLETAINEEKYEIAAEIRDAIEKRK
ncbi:MAG: bifunctional nuclease domain-containing protein [Paludibacteraceae bacterium]